MGKASRQKKLPLSATRDLITADAAPGIANSGSRVAAISCALALLVFLVFGQVITHDFINYDDPDYVSANPIVQQGWSIEGVKYAFTALQPYYWQPLTWLSLEMFGGSARAQLIANVVLHAAAVVLLFLLLQSTTAATWTAAFAAAIWGLHPLRIESVAWIAERKDVLSTMLFLATILAYVRGRRALTIILFALALMAKPMVVTLPIVLLLVDIWPLRKRPTIADKIPLAVLAVAVVFITFLGQRGAIASTLPLAMRAGNAIVSYVAYLGKIFVPAHLAVIYPYPAHLDAWKVALSALILIGISAAAAYVKRPQITSGWLWYLCTLVPVIGIVQAGAQSMADRFTYIPSIGIIVALAWTIRIVAVGVIAVIACCVITIFNLPYWRDSVALFTHAVSVTNENALAYVKLGDAHLAQNRVAEANDEYAKAVEYSHGAWLPLASQGIGFVAQKRYVEAVPLLERALALHGDTEATRENYAYALMNTGHPVDATAQFEAAMRLDRTGARRAELLQGLGDAKRLAGRMDEGITDLRASIDVKPTAVAWNDLGSAYSAKGDMDAADRAFTTAIGIDPNLYDAHMNYAAVLSRTGRNDDAAAQIREAMRIDPKNVEPRIYLAIVNAASGKKAEAAALAGEAQAMDAHAANDIFTRALHLPPNDANLQQFIERMR